MIIDEVQRVPEIFLAIKRDVDKHRIPARYLLTGSANPLLIPKLGDSLVGRMEIIDLMTLSQGEIYNKKIDFIDLAFSNHQFANPKNPLIKEELYRRAMVGGYPSVQSMNAEAHQAWMRNYLNLLLQRDIKDLAAIEKLTEMPKLLQILAFRSSNLLNIAEVARDAKLVAKTVERYIALLKTIFIIHLQLAWSANSTLRFTKSPKLYINDTGLQGYLLGFNLNRALEDNVIMGRVVENFVIEELRKQATWSHTRVSLYHFRTTDGQEVDLVLEDRLGNIVGIEVKSSSRVTPDDFKGLSYLQRKAGRKFLKGFVIYTGNQTVPFGNNLYALPINLVWEE